MATVRFTDDDRDSRGFIRLSPPVVVADDAPAEPASIEPPRQPRPAAQARPPLSPRLRYRMTMGAAAVAGLAMVILTMRLASTEAPAPALPRPTTASIAAPTAAPTVPTTAPVVAGRLLIAFAAPDGDALGAIESTRAITPTAHYGKNWIQANVAGSGLVWLRAADSPELAIIGPDLAPAPTARPAPATATPEPPPCASAGVPGKMVEVCGDGDLDAQAQAKWIATYGGNAGIVTTPTPWNGGKQP